MTPSLGKRAAALVAGALLAAAPIAPAAADGAKSDVHLCLNVPPCCSAEAVCVDEAGTIAIKEMCNSGGSVLIAHHDPALGGRAVFVYDSQRIDASASGITEVYRFAGASNSERTLVVEGVNPSELAGISFVLIPCQ